MDPNATVDRLYLIVTEGGDPEAARELAVALDVWLSSGGFVPDADRVRKLAVVAARLIEDFWL